MRGLLDGTEVSPIITLFLRRSHPFGTPAPSSKDGGVVESRSVQALMRVSSLPFYLFLCSGISLYKYPSASYISAMRAAYSPSPARSVAVLLPSVPSKPGCPRKATLAGGHGTKMARRRKSHGIKGGMHGDEQQQQISHGGGEELESSLKGKGTTDAVERC